MAAEGYTKIESLQEQIKEPGGDYQRWMAELQAADKELTNGEGTAGRSSKSTAQKGAK